MTTDPEKFLAALTRAAASPPPQHSALVLARDSVGAPDEPDGDPVNVANTITLVGYGLGLWWVAGGPAWSAVASILLDEVDGVVARERGETTQFGSTLDWGSDIILTALTLRRLRAPLWMIPTATLAQVYLRNEGFRPPLGSLRAGLMLFGVIKEGYEKKGLRALRGQL